MRIKTKIEDYRPLSVMTRKSYYGYWFSYQTTKEVILLNKIEQILADLFKGIFSYVCTCICSIIAIGIMEIKKIYSVKRVWYGDSIVILNNNINLT